jgi:hypothetical protein
MEPKSRFRIRSLRAKRSNLAFSNEIATHLSGARNDRPRKGFPFLNRDLGGDRVRTIVDFQQPQIFNVRILQFFRVSGWTV